jgi:hypothetical protein
MAYNNSRPAKSSRGRTLSFLISAGMVMSATIPLLITLGYIWLQTRPVLIDQANSAMTNDAQTRVQIIDTYFHERLLDAKTLTQVTVVQQLLMQPTSDTPTYQNAQVHARYALQAGLDRNPDYTNWALFDTQGRLRLSLPATPTLPKRGNNFYSAQQLADIKAGKEFISPVFYNPTTHQTSVDIFAPVAPINAQGQSVGVVGFLRATLKLTTVNALVKQSSDVHGNGSYAFILDNQGVRIADADTKRLLTSVMPLSATVQHLISQGQLYTTQQPIRVVADATLADALKRTSTGESFQGNLNGAGDTYQIVRHAASEVPWQYFIVSPVSSVTQTASTQINSIIIIAIFMSLIVATFGIMAGRSITRPIQQAVIQLQNDSQTLNTLSGGQQEAATEQVWVVESSQVGLQSVQYYADATRTAIQHLRENAQVLYNTLPDDVPPQTKQALSYIFEAANYIENATKLQGNSSQKLATALKVATQVTAQLHIGATSTAETAAHLEEVVQELRAVVKR